MGRRGPGDVPRGVARGVPGQRRDRVAKHERWFEVLGSIVAMCLFDTAATSRFGEDPVHLHI